MAEDTPETLEPPRLFRGITEFEKLLLLRYLRPDRMMSALQQFVAGQIGRFFVEPPAIDMHEIEKEADKFTPIFIVLFPGVDPTPALEAIARSKGCTAVSHARLSKHSVGNARAIRQAYVTRATPPADDLNWIAIKHKRFFLLRKTENS